ncbi:hypothetical protein IGW_05061 [Bacillus cereus ISP3191]|uniref:hypothetical protein n=1 Tax=Bacillus cereus group TaxID=86661 RepID=UPI0002796909|nr:hypothetical protein [Bacillus cereus]EJQ88382.1 hypothetical protein IGW_05061 [Bacillus cereus ISP3191]MDR4323114.1 hypothetical protein [Bacillus paranthracis]QUW31423.1 hypothetical protein J8Y17_25305 [Bacillus cereus]
MIQIHADYETPSNAGADGLFQIFSVILIDENGKETDLTDQIDQGDFYRNAKQVLKDLNLPLDTDYEFV